MRKHIPFIVLFIVFSSQFLLVQFEYPVSGEQRKNIGENQIITIENTKQSKETVFSTKAFSNKSWTYMLYLDADNDIEGDAIRDFEWLEQAGGSDENISIVVLFDRIPGYDNTHGNWNSSRIYNVTDDASPTTIDSQLMVDLGEVDMADPDTLTDFINYCFEYFPAENYILDLWDHGHAAYGVIDDETSGTHFIVNDVQTAITNALATTTEEIDIISMDACDMMTIEVAWELRNLCKYFIATEDNTNGYQYELIEKRLKLNPQMNASSLCELMVDAYSDYYIYGLCLSVINQTKLLDTPEIFNTFVTELIVYLEDGSRADIFGFVRDITFEFYDGNWIDLIAFVENVGYFLEDSSLNLVTEEFLSFLDKLVLYNWQHRNYYGNANGVTIFMPLRPNTNEFIDQYVNGLGFCSGMDWQSATLWDEFLTFYVDNSFHTSSMEPQLLTLDESKEGCSIQQNSIQMYRVNLWQKSIYEFSCQITSGDIDIKVMKYDSVGTYELLGGSYLVNPEDGTTESCRFYLQTGFYLILVYSNISISNYDVIVRKCDSIDLVCNSPYTLSGGSINGDAQGHFKQDLYHYFQIEIPYGNNTITLSNSETANCQLTIYDEDWKVLYFVPAEGFGQKLTLFYNQTYEGPTTFILEISGFDGEGEFTIEVKNPNEPTPKASIYTWQIVFFVPIIFFISKIKRDKKSL